MRIAILILIAGAFGGCMCGTLTRDEFAEKYPYGEGTLLSHGGFEPVLKELEQRVGGAVSVTGITVRPGSAYFTVRDPKKPGNLDGWAFDGGRWRDPEPVQTSRQEAEDATSFSPSEIPALGKLRELSEKTLAELKIENGRIESVAVGKSKTIEVTIYVKGPRETGRATFDAAGVLTYKHVD